MARTILYIVAGILLGAVIHLVVILMLPQVADHPVSSRIADLAGLSTTTIVPVPKRDQENPLRLDPYLSYAVCRLDLSEGPGELTGTLPSTFWSLAVYDLDGTVIYSTTNRDGIGQKLDLGLFDPAQTRLLAEQKIDIAPGLLIVETQSDEVMVVVRLAQLSSTVRARYEAQLARLACRNIAL